MLLGLGALGVMMVLGLYVLLFWFVGSSKPTSQAEMIPPILAWGRLAPFPKSAKNLEIHTEGGMFTRGFRALFTAPAADVERWLKASPGTREAKQPEPATIRRYDIAPGDGANRALVTVENGTLVEIYVSWS